MIIKRQKEFTSKATKALRKHILGTTGTPRELWMTNKEYEREIAEAAKEKLGRGQVERKLSSKQINRKIKFHEDRYKTATNPSTHDYHKSQLDLWKARRKEHDHPKIERERRTFIFFKNVNGEPKIDKVKNFSDMILKRQKEFASVRKATKAGKMLAKETIKALESENLSGVVNASKRAINIKGSIRNPKTPSAMKGYERVINNTANNSIKILPKEYRLEAKKMALGDVKKKTLEQAIENNKALAGKTRQQRISMLKSLID